MVKLLGYTKQVILQFTISYYVSFNYGYHNKTHFISHFSAVKFAVGYEQNIKFLLIAKSLKVLKKLKKSTRLL